MTDSGKLALNKHIQWLYYSIGLAQLGRTGGSFQKYYSQFGDFGVPEAERSEALG